MGYRLSESTHFLPVRRVRVPQGLVANPRRVAALSRILAADGPAAADPIIVFRYGGKYALVAGIDRLRAAEAAKLPTILTRLLRRPTREEIAMLRIVDGHQRERPAFRFATRELSELRDRLEATSCQAADPAADRSTVSTRDLAKMIALSHTEVGFRLRSGPLVERTIAAFLEEAPVRKHLADALERVPRSTFLRIDRITREAPKPEAAFQALLRRYLHGVARRHLDRSAVDEVGPTDWMLRKAIKMGLAPDLNRRERRRRGFTGRVGAVSMPPLHEPSAQPIPVRGAIAESAVNQVSRAASLESEHRQVESTEAGPPDLLTLLGNLVGALGAWMCWYGIHRRLRPRKGRSPAGPRRG